MTITILDDYKLTFDVSHHCEYGASVKNLSAELVCAPRNKRQAGGQTKKATTVGYLQATLIRRPVRDGFLELCDALSQELCDISGVYFDDQGHASQLKHPLLTAFPSAVVGGGLLQIYVVEIHPDHQKKDLGLWMIHWTMVHCRRHFTLAVAVPCCLATRLRRWGQDSLSTSEDATAQEKASTNKVRRHFVRLGFHQAGQREHERGQFFLARDNYFFRANVPEDAVQRWMTRDEATAKLYGERASPLDGPLTTSDRLLVKEIKAAKANTSKSALTAKMEALVAEGASPSKAMHTATAHTTVGPPILRTLVRLGADVNARHSCGQTPLHVAAMAKQRDTIATLLELGADCEAVDDDGLTPCLRYVSQIKDYDRTEHDEYPRWSAVEQDLEIIRLLLPAKLKAVLVDGWLSPLMDTRIQVGADLLEFDDDSLAKCFHTSNSDEQRSASIRGAQMVVHAFQSVIVGGATPTVERVRAKVPNLGDGDMEDYRTFLDCKGSIEDVIRCVIRQAKEVADNEDELAGDLDDDDEDNAGGFSETEIPVLDCYYDLARYMCLHHLEAQ